jgi:hypothetical protein
VPSIEKGTMPSSSHNRRRATTSARGATGAYGQAALPLFDADPCAGHHHGAETSVAAHERVRPHKRQSYSRILDALRARGPAGGTVHEIAADLGKPDNHISGRLFELRRALVLTFLYDQGAVVKRGGCRVLIIADRQQA